MTQPDLTPIRDAHAAATRAADALTAAVAVAIANGATWEQVGRELGITAQAAWRRFVSRGVTRQRRPRSASNGEAL